MDPLYEEIASVPTLKNDLRDMRAPAALQFVVDIPDAAWHSNYPAMWLGYSNKFFRLFKVPALIGMLLNLPGFENQFRITVQINDNQTATVTFYKD